MTLNDEQLRLSRRGFLTAGAAGAGVLAAGALGGWTPAFAVPAGSAGLPRIARIDRAGRAASDAAGLPERHRTVPAGVPELVQGDHAGRHLGLLAQTPQDVVRLANWAHEHDYKIRPRGAMHGWTPLTVEKGPTSRR